MVEYAKGGKLDYLIIPCSSQKWKWSYRSLPCPHLGVFIHVQKGRGVERVDRETVSEIEVDARHAFFYWPNW